MGIEKNGIYKVFNGTDFDTINLKTTALQVKIDDAGSLYVSTEVEGALKEVMLKAKEYTASDVLNKLKTVDGKGSGLDADTVQGKPLSSLVVSEYLVDTNLNTVYTEGIYSVESAQNYVESSAGTLIVGSSSGKDNYIRQLWLPEMSNSVYTRYCDEYKSWQPFIKIGADANTVKGVDIVKEVTESTQILTDTGSVNTIVLNVPNFKDKKKYSFKAANTSTGAVTINGVPLKKPDGTVVNGGGIKAGRVYDFYFDSTANSVFILAKAEGTAVAGDVLAGKTFSNDNDSGLVGTIPSKPACVITPDIVDQVINGGQYLSGNQVIQGDSNLISENIKSGVSIFGVEGDTSVVDTSDVTAESTDILIGKTAYMRGRKTAGQLAPKLFNLIRNGDFEDVNYQNLGFEALDNCSLSTLSPKTGTKCLSVTTKTNCPEGFVWFKNVPYTQGHTYYIGFWSKSNKPITHDLYFPFIYPYWGSVSGLTNTGNNTWQYMSAILAPSSTPSGVYQLRLDLNNNYISQDVMIDGMMVFDLTDTFGPGKELEQSRIDSIVLNDTLNLMRYDGDCSDVSKFDSPWQSTNIVDTSIGMPEIGGIKGTLTSNTGNFANYAVTNIMKPDKYYLISAYLKNGNASNISLCVGAGSTFDVVTSIYWTRTGIRWKGTIDNNHISVKINGSVGQYGYVDSIMINEISKEEYGDSNGAASQSLLNKYPYTEGNGGFIQSYMDSQSIVSLLSSKPNNLIRNGSFENGDNCWDDVSADLDTGIYKFGSNSKKFVSDGSVAKIQGQIVPRIKNHVYYASGWFMRNGSLDYGAQLDMAISPETDFVDLTNNTIPAVNSWCFVSAIAVSQTDSNGIFRVFSYNKSALWADGLMLIDLTDTFGAGKEPSKTQMDAIVLANGGWWDSNLTILTKDATAAPNDILIGKKAYSNGSLVSGTCAPKITNLIRNGGFENGLNCWSYSNVSDTSIQSSDVKYGSKALTVTTSSDCTEGYLYHDVYYSQGHKYYFCYSGKASSNITSEVFFPLAAGQSANAPLDLTPSSDYGFNSAVIPIVNSVASGMQQLRFDFNNNGAVGTKTVDGFMLIDLTDTFGAGKEPLKVQMDAIVLANGGWWDSNLTILTKDATATADKIISGYSAYTNGTRIDGTAEGMYIGKTIDLDRLGMKYMQDFDFRTTSRTFFYPRFAKNYLYNIYYSGETNSGTIYKINRDSGAEISSFGFSATYASSYGAFWSDTDIFNGRMFFHIMQNNKRLIYVDDGGEHINEVTLPQNIGYTRAWANTSSYYVFVLEDGKTAALINKNTMIVVATVTFPVGITQLSAVPGSDLIFATHTDNTVRKYTLSGTSLTQISSVSNSYKPYHITAINNDTAYITVSNAGGTACDLVSISFSSGSRTVRISGFYDSSSIKYWQGLVDNCFVVVKGNGGSTITYYNTDLTNPRTIVTKNTTIDDGLNVSPASSSGNGYWYLSTGNTINAYGYSPYAYRVLKEKTVQY